jgi:hypothetical protein
VEMAADLPHGRARWAVSALSCVRRTVRVLSQLLIRTRAGLGQGRRINNACGMSA